MDLVSSLTSGRQLKNYRFDFSDYIKAIFNSYFSSISFGYDICTQKVWEYGYIASLTKKHLICR